MILPRLILEVEVVKQRRCLQMQRKSIEDLYLVIRKAVHGMDRIAKVSSIAIRGKMVKFTGMVEKNLPED
ncbi:hypothetical protein QE84_003358 [Salmonella enterica subsp. enterica]|uniref:Uncharacterized protein n=1 Tax=Salmonella enterica I TaxID=59201 RepID=A0A5H5IIS8_SALET|nr:hypothetical protein [Salmonella enterica subsp. enterica serovar Ajiobo]EAC1006237.1 hypothetical protein [Salmonella enterica subsp. enterica]EAU1471637.1 hypothetical protein [Salmonella enterica]EBW2328296.1 hypothetical protein [Salmonella enterica subsp. enterica serovar Agoueve]ECY4210806.1 hypothetical protein [Salmonella enterica subsp. enterica serovar Typhimurium]EDR1227322.1 hypothetical protein [Salmonella enterica subsp. enterica serovar Gateshead]